MREIKVGARGIKFVLVSNEGKDVARAYLYLLKNDLHDRPLGFVEDVFVDENFRGMGYGTLIMKALIERAKQLGCYKLVATSRYGRERVHKFYKDLGFREHGKEFRMDFK